MGDTKHRKNAAKEEQVLRERLLKKADEIVKAWDQAYIFQAGHHEEREFPKFGKEEITVGKRLGRGGFCDVLEVSKIVLQSKNFEKDVKEGTDINPAETDDHQDEPFVVEIDLPTPTTTRDENEIHYEVTKARDYMSTHFLRQGDARYAIKRLRTDRSELEQIRAMIDLAVEIKLFSVIWHPNIGRCLRLHIWTKSVNVNCRFLTSQAMLLLSLCFEPIPIVKMRGVSDMSCLSMNSFIVMDRLYGTLDEKIASWRSVRKRNGGLLGITGTNKQVLHNLLKERLIVAYDLAEAFDYMHSHR